MLDKQTSLQFHIGLLILLIAVLLPGRSKGQVQQLTFIDQKIDFSAPPRSTISPMSIKLWDNYGSVGGPTNYGTVMEIYGLNAHQTGQFFFAGWDNSKIRYREAFYAQNSWSDWMTILDSKNNVTSSGNLQITGAGSHYLAQGNFGLGTLTPAAKISFKDVTEDNADGITWYNPRPFEYGIHRTMGSWLGPNYQQLRLGWETGIVIDPGSLYGKSYVDVQGNGMRITSGSLGIGTIDTKDYKLAVAGKMIAVSVKVQLQNEWADYVFAEGYKLESLPNLEKFIKKNQHLPDLPSATEVKVDGGIDLGEMNIKLLQKIEELTLHLIEQNKRLDAIDKMNKELQTLIIKPKN